MLVPRVASGRELHRHPQCDRLPVVTEMGRTCIFLAVTAACTLAVLGQSGGQLGRGIQDVKARIATNEQIVNQLANEVNGYVLKIGKIIYTSYGHEGDPGRALLDLKDKIERNLETLAAARAGQPNTGRIAQLILDDWSELNPVVKNLNATQEIIGQLAPLIETLWQRNNYQQQIVMDSQILGTLQTENANLAQRSNNPQSAPPPPTPTVSKPRTQAGAFDFSPLDDAVSVSRWRDLGNRAFSSKAEEEAFYQRHPEYLKYRKIAELRSPADDIGRQETPSESSARGEPSPVQQPEWDLVAYNKAMQQCRSADAPRRRGCLSQPGSDRAKLACLDAANSALSACADAAKSAYGPKR